MCSWWRRSHCWLCWYYGNERKNDLLSICGPEVRVWMWGCDHVPSQISAVTFSMLLWCFCSLSRSVGRATLMNLWIGASRRLSVSLLASSAMCPADCPQPTPLCNLDTAPAQLYLTAPTDTVNTSRVWDFNKYINQFNKLCDTCKSAHTSKIGNIFFLSTIRLVHRITGEFLADSITSVLKLNQSSSPQWIVIYQAKMGFVCFGQLGLVVASMYITLGSGELWHYSLFSDTV